MTDALKNPPVLTDDVEYSNWKADLTIWGLYTSLEKKKRGPALYLSLQGKARECIRGLTPEEIGGDTGVDLIVAKLDNVFEEDENMRTFICFKRFYDYRRPSGTSIKEFVIQYEELYRKLGTFDIKLREGVQAFFFLTASNISDEYEKLARATCGNMKYKDIKQTILKIFSDPAAGNTSDEPVPSIKSEPIYKVSHNYRGGVYNRGEYRGGYRGGYRGRGRGSYNFSDGNPKDRDGNTMKCYKCNSTKHFAKYCK